MTKRETRDRERPASSAAGAARSPERRAPSARQTPRGTRPIEEVKRPAPRLPPPPPAAAKALSPEEAEQARRVKLATIGGGVFTVLVGMVYGGLEFGPPAVVLGLMGLALIAVIALFWNSIRTLIGETRLTGEDAFAIGAPRAEEEQKRAVLRALKDLEFERAVGKISEEDYGVLAQRYRTEAKRLLRQIDEATAEQRARAEALVGGRLRSVGIAPDPIAARPAAKSVPAKPEGAQAQKATTRGADDAQPTARSRGPEDEVDEDDEQEAADEAQTAAAVAKPVKHA